MSRRPSISQLEAFLRGADKTFPVPLSEKRELGAYARKLYEKATLCAAYEGEDIISLAAGYTDNITDGMAYLAIAATLPRARGQGLASRLVKEFIQICAQKGIRAVHLYAVPTNIPAMHMYMSLGFQNLALADEPRKDDAHLIYYLKGN